MKTDNLKILLKKVYDKELSVEKAGQLLSKGFSKIYSTSYKIDNNLELLKMVLDLYSTIVLKNTLTKTQKEVLLYYLKNGYSSEVKESIIIDFKIKPNHLNNINWNLTDKGYLVKHPTNKQSKLVSKELLFLRDSFLKGHCNFFSIKFEKES